MNKSVIEQKPVIVLGNFWQAVIDTLTKELMFEGKESCTRYITIVPSPKRAVEALKTLLHQPPH